MFVGAHEILSLFANDGRDLIHIVNFSVRAFSLSTKSLLTKANDLSFFVDRIFIHCCPAILCWVSVSIEFFSILREKVFTCNFFNCRIKINNILFQFVSLVVLIWYATLTIYHSRMHTMILIQKLNTLIQWQRPNLWQFQVSRISLFIFVYHLELLT